MRKCNVLKKCFDVILFQHIFRETRLGALGQLGYIRLDHATFFSQLRCNRQTHACHHLCAHHRPAQFSVPPLGLQAFPKFPKEKKICCFKHADFLLFITQPSCRHELLVVNVGMEPSLEFTRPLFTFWPGFWERSSMYLFLPNYKKTGFWERPLVPWCGPQISKLHIDSNRKRKCTAFSNHPVSHTNACG